MKNFLSLIMCIILLFGFAGCGNNSDGPDDSEAEIEAQLSDFKGKPEYTEQKEMLISGYWAPKPTLEQFQWIKDANFTHIYLEDKYGVHGSENYIKALELAEQVGIKVIAQRYNEKKPLLDDPTDYSKYPAFAGYNAWDEPNKDEMSTIENDIIEFNKKYQGRDDINLYSNLFGHYAKPEQMGFTDFFRYVDYYAKNLSSKITSGKKIISVDAYPLLSSRGENLLYSGHLSSLEAVANSARRYNLEPYFFIQDMSFGDIHRAPLQQDLDLQVYTCFAFGMKGIQHFTYRTPQEAPGGEFTYDKNGNLQLGLIDRDDKKTQTWEWAKNVNEEIKRLQNVYLSFKWDGVMGVEGTEYQKTGDISALREPLEKHNRIKSFTATGDTVMGCFTDENNYQGFMITPYTETTDNFVTEIEVVFRKAEKALIYTDGNPSVVNLENGKLSLSVNPGEGVFVIPYNEI